MNHGDSLSFPSRTFRASINDLESPPNFALDYRSRVSQAMLMLGLRCVLTELITCSKKEKNLGEKDFYKVLGAILDISGLGFAVEIGSAAF
jgi:hypothetical protein